MAGASSKTNPPRARKRVDAETATSLKRARDGSAFTRCEECKKDVPVVLIDMHSCSLDSKIKMNLDAQVIEKAAEAKKATEKSKVAKLAPKSAPKAKKSKKEKDPNMPKRPQTAFFLFMDGFRKEFSEANPDNKSIGTVAKAGGEKWKAMTDEEKKPYLDKNIELKAEYDKAMEKYNADDKEVVDVDDKEEQEGSEKEEEKEEEE